MDNYISKVHPLLFKLLSEPSASERETQASQYVKTVEKELEPLLPEPGSNGKFFGGKKDLTMAEVLTASFIARLYMDLEDEIRPKSLLKGLEELPRFAQWAKAVREHASVKTTWDEDGTVGYMKARILKMRESAKA